MNRKPLIILGIDPGIATTGFGVITLDENKIQGKAYGCITTKSDLSTEKRLRQIYEEVTALISKYQPDAIAIEEVFFGINVKTAFAVGQAKGVVLLAIANSNVTAVEYTPLQVKQALVGYGRAQKRQIQYMVQKLLCLEEIPKPDDASDALALAICHAHSTGLLKRIKTERVKKEK